MFKISGKCNLVENQEEITTSNIQINAVEKSVEDLFYHITGLFFCIKFKKNNYD